MSNTFDISGIASLARLNITDSDKAKLQDDMNKIIAYIDQLSELDITGVEPTLHAADLKNVWREDSPKKQEMKDKILKNAPETVDNEFIKVPKVLEEL